MNASQAQTLAQIRERHEKAPDYYDRALAHSDRGELLAILAAIDMPGQSWQRWRCFHCDEVFTAEVDARNHFGTREDSDPACRIKAAGEFALLAALRNAEDALNRYRSEDSDIIRAMQSMVSDNARALICEEEKGFTRGLEDAKKHPETLGLVAAGGAVNPLALHAFAMSERYLSGYRLILGFDTLTKVQAAHKEVCDIAHLAKEQAALGAPCQ
jgi:hypothetical protein